MNRDSSPYLLKNTDYILGVNINSENESGESLNVQLEPSNYYGINFPENYKVVGHKTDLLKNRTYYFLTSVILDENSEDFKKSSIGYVDNDGINNINYNNEEETNLNSDCDSCGIKAFNPLTTALENVSQTPSLQYVELINDKCLNVSEGLNFDINFPIKKIEINQEKLGTTLYWNDNNNPPRFLNITDVEEKGNQSYLYEVEEPCEDPTYDTCINVDKLLIFPKHNRIVLEASEEQTGGNLKLGTYEFWAAYCDLLGNEMTQYSTPTNPISIFDENNSILNQTELDEFTNFAIKLKIRNLDTEHFKYYKVAVVERNNVNNTQSVFLAGIYPTTDDTVLYTHSGSSNDDLYIARGNVSLKKRMDFNTLNSLKPHWKKAKTTMVSGDTLWHIGLEQEEELNIQPVLNLFGGLLHWETSAASENLYKSAIATSKYKGYSRNEVQPFGIRLLYKNGGYSATFPLIARPKISGDNDTITSDKNLDSILANNSECSISDRNKRWQIYNTAYAYDELCTDIEDSAIETEETITKTCTVDNVHTIEAGSVVIPITEEYYDFISYVQDNPDSPYLTPITDELNVTYPGLCTPAYVGDCDSPVYVSEVNTIGDVENIVETLDPKDENDYVVSIPPNTCSPYQRKTDGSGFEIDPDSEDFLGCGEVAYIRDGNFYNETCGYADSVTNKIDPSTIGTPTYLNYAHDLVEANLLQPSWGVHPSTITGDFKNKLHKKAQFFKVNKESRDSLYLEFTKMSNCPTDNDDIPETNQVRYTIYDDCTTPTVLNGGVVDLTVGSLTFIDISTYPGNSFIIAIDAPIISNTNCASTTAYIVAPPCGCFYMYTRDIEYVSRTISWDSITLDKVQTYEATCTFKIPNISDCDIVPYRRGVMSYWESTETYPNNAQLWDSSNLNILPSDLEQLSIKDREEFISYYTNGLNESGVYILKDVDFRCQPIRHHKFPDNTVAPYMIDNSAFQREADSIIFPLGVELDSNVIKTVINIAYFNGLITKKQRDNIQGYEILRGDNSVSKSVIANGIAFDFYNYTKENEVINFSNFPFNDLGKNKFCLTEKNGQLIDHPYNSEKNHLYSFISPDLIITKPSIPTEVLLQGFVMGATNSEFAAVDKHSEWTVLGEKARSVSTTLAIAEVALELIIKTGELFHNQWFVAGLSSGGSIVGTAAAIAATAGIAANGLINVGKYRYDWLKTFRDLGRTYNFASFQAASANYNRFLKADQYSEEYLRKLSIRKYLKEGYYTFVDESNAKEIRVNNWKREDSVFLSTGEDYPFDYSIYSDYTSFDNNKVQNFGSNFVASEVGAKENVKFQRNVASPYFTLKNYIPDQWGKVDSIKWLTTNYIFDLNESTACKPIYGGTVFISRFSWRRKTPIFRKDAIGLADKLPFMYSRYDNIGFPRFYCNYELDDSDNMYNGFLGVPYPDINSEARFDSQTGKSSMYYKPPSKFYTSVHGVVYFLVESEINCNFRYEGKEPKEWFYPRHQNLTDWLQETKLPMSEPNTFFYNNTYSIGVSNSPYKFLDVTYDKEVWAKRAVQTNAVTWSQKEVNENDLTNPWLVYKPLDWYEFKTNNGKLIDMHNIESNQFIARFENRLMLHNAIDVSSEKLTPQNKELGVAGMFYQRPLEFKSTDLGFMGTQHSDIVSTPYGHFWVDALRGKIFKLDQNGQGLEIISEQSGNQPSNMKQWFREHLPMKILKSLPQIDIDNKYKGIGYNMWFDDRESRLFITKRDYILKQEGLQYTDELGLYKEEEEEIITCPEGFDYNVETGKCERLNTSLPLCPSGYVYDEETQTCTLISTTSPICTCAADVFAEDQTIYSGDTTNIMLTSTEVGIGYNWTVAQNNVTGATNGSGALISQTLTGEGTVIYTITPYEIANGCLGTPLQIVVTVEVPSIPCGGSLTVSEEEGYYEIPVVIGSNTGMVEVTFNARVVPDRIQLIYDGNVVADSLFIGDGLPSVPYETEIINVTSLNKYLYNGSPTPPFFDPNGTISVDYSASDIADSTGNPGTLRSVGNVGGQIGVVANYPLPTAKASDGDIKLTFNKTTSSPTTMSIVVIGINTGTLWDLVDITCP